MLHFPIILNNEFCPFLDDFAWSNSTVLWIFSVVERNATHVLTLLSDDNSANTGMYLSRLLQMHVEIAEQECTLVKNIIEVRAAISFM